MTRISRLNRARCVVLACTVTLGACRGGEPPAPVPHRIEDARVTMGSNLTFVAWAADDASTHRAFDAAFAEFEHLDALLSVWRPDSDVSRINSAAGEEAVTVAPETIEVLDLSRRISDETGGTFDITFGALTDVWKFDHDQDGSVPSDADISQRLGLIDYRQVIVDDAARTVRIGRKGMRIHLGGIGKGYAVDRAVAILREHGLRDFMIQAGGDLYVAGQRGDRPWRLGIADPRNADGKPFATIELSDATLSTSGDYERSFIKDGVRYHHILDPRIGQPARGTRSVTLVSKRAVVADALAKGVFILGPEEGLALIEREPDVEGVIVTAKNDVLVSSGLKERVALVHPPTDAP